MHTAHVACVRRILNAAELQGHEPADLLARAKVSAAAPLFLNTDLSNARRDHWVAIEPVFAVWDYAAVTFPGTRLLDDLVEALPAEELGPLGFLMLTATSLQASLNHMMSHFAVITTSGEWQCRVAGRQVSLVWERVARSAGQCLANEAIFAHIVVILARLGTSGIAPRRILFHHGPLATSATLARLLPTCIEYSAGQNALIFDREELSDTPRLANGSMASYFQGQLGEQLALVRSKQSIVESLRSELRRETTLSDESLGATSERLKISSRTLQRKLELSSTSFSQELTRARQERAFELVTRSRRPLSEVANELGFADASAFSRAFRRWFSSPPSELRRLRAR